MFHLQYCIISRATFFDFNAISGILTKQLIYYHFRNTIEDMCKGYRVYCNKLYAYLAKNLKWIEQTVRMKPKEDLYWKQVGFIAFYRTTL